MRRPGGAPLNGDTTLRQWNLLTPFVALKLRLRARRLRLPVSAIRCAALARPVKRSLPAWRRGSPLAPAVPAAVEAPAPPEPPARMEASAALAEAPVAHTAPWRVPVQARPTAVAPVDLPALAA